MSKKLKNAAKSLRRALSFRSTKSRTSSQTASSRAASEMEVDPPSPIVHGFSSQYRKPKVFTSLDTPTLNSRMTRRKAFMSS
jgi:hypothetical protein